MCGILRGRPMIVPPWKQSSGLFQAVLYNFKNIHRLSRWMSIVLALPIFPGSHPPSIVGANELNFCVRDGNRWTLTAINTNFSGGFLPPLCQSLSALTASLF